MSDVDGDVAGDVAGDGTRDGTRDVTRDMLAKRTELIYRGKGAYDFTLEPGRLVSVYSSKHEGMFYKVIVEGFIARVFYGDGAWVGAARYAGTYNFEAEDAVRDECEGKL